MKKFFWLVLVATFFLRSVSGVEGVLAPCDGTVYDELKSYRNPFPCPTNTSCQAGTINRQVTDPDGGLISVTEYVCWPKKTQATGNQPSPSSSKYPHLKCPTCPAVGPCSVEVTEKLTGDLVCHDRVLRQDIGLPVCVDSKLDYVPERKQCEQRVPGGGTTGNFPGCTYGVSGDIHSLGCLSVIIVRLINFAYVFLQAITILLVLWGAVRYVISRGDAKAIQEAQKTITFALAGAGVVLGAYIIINIVSNMLGFGDLLSKFSLYQK